MNRYHLEINGLWEKPVKGTGSLNSPTAGPHEHGDKGWKKTAAPEAAERELDRSTKAIMSCENHPVLRGPLLIPS